MPRLTTLLTAFLSITILFGLTGCPDDSDDHFFDAEISVGGGNGTGVDGDGAQGGNIIMDALLGITIQRADTALPTQPAYNTTGPEANITTFDSLSNLVPSVGSLDVSSSALLEIDTNTTLTVAGDVRIRGLVEADLSIGGDANNTLTIVSTAGDFWIDNGIIDNGGFTFSPGATGGDGMDINLTADQGDFYIDGSILTRGDESFGGGDGGNGADINITATLGNIYVYDAGVLTARGGHSSNGAGQDDGGSAGDITLSAPAGEIIIMGVAGVSAEGGRTNSGTVPSLGDGGTITLGTGLAAAHPLTVDVDGLVLISANGGAEASGTGPAADGGTITVNTRTVATMTPGAELQSNGGKGDSGPGGTGGTITINANTTPGGAGVNVAILGGTIDLDAGQGSPSGTGGTLNIDANTSDLLNQTTGKIFSNGFGGSNGGTMTLTAVGTATNDGLIQIVGNAAGVLNLGGATPAGTGTTTVDTTNP